MEFLAQCPLCGGSERQAWPGELASFIAHRVFSSGPIACRVVECGTCGLRYSDLRLDGDETGRLYLGYRGPEYFRLRHAYEPWYSRCANDGLGSAAAEIYARRDYLEGILRGEGVWGNIRSVLDFGGDRGQFIPASLKADKWVYDISGMPTEPEVRACSRLEDLDKNSFDLVMLCHVLEHAMDPMALIQTNASLLAEGGTLYVEVPLERPRINSGPGFRISNPCFHKVWDFLSTVPRVIFGWVPPGAMLKISEHVNFFDEQSLQTAMKKAGLRVLRLEAKTSCCSFGRTGTLHCLAVKPPAQSGV